MTQPPSSAKDQTDVADIYDQDGLTSIHNHDFMGDPAFHSAYERGVQAAGGADYQWHWRVHIGLWAARTAVQVPGDFVECGVNRGVMSAAIMHDLDWNRLGRRFFLLDTFAGLDPEHTTDGERSDGILDKNRNLLDTGFYVTSADHVRETFRDIHGVEIIVGSVPETLSSVTAERIAFLHIDMNAAPPEIAALRALWPRMSRGGIVLLDDYAYRGYEHQKHAMDALAGELGCHVASLPTGQGLIVKSGPEPSVARRWWHCLGF